MLSAILLSLIIFPVLLSLLLSVPSIQNFVIHRAAAFATEALGTTVSVRRITIGFPNKVRVRGFYVEDLDRDTLIYADGVTAHLSGFGKGRLTLSMGRVENGKFILRETERGPMNVKEITDRLSRKRGAKFLLNIRSLDVEHVDFRMERITRRNPVHGVDYGNMRIYDICSHIDGFFVDTGAVGGNITRLSMWEHSGFVLDDMTAGSLLVDRGKILFSQLCIKSGNSDIYLPELSLRGEGWESYRDYIRNVRMDVLVEHSAVESHDAAYFAPSLLRWDTSVSDATLSMHGTVADFEASIDRATLADGGTLAARAKVRGLVNIPRTHFDVEVSELSASSDEVMHLLRGIARIELPEKIVPFVGRTDRLSLRGSFKGRLSDFAVDADLGLGCGGTVSLEGTLQKRGGVSAIVAAADLADVDVGRILDSRLFGEVSLSFAGNAALGVAEERTADVKGAVSSALINGCRYSGISFDARADGGDIEASVVSADKNVDFDLQSVISLGGEEPKYSAVMDLRHADLVAMNINRRDSVSVLSAQVAAMASGRDIDTMDGEVSIADATYAYNSEVLASERVFLSVVGNEDTRTVELSSDFADALFESRSPYRDVLYYAKNLLNRYIPTLYTSSAREDIERRSEGLRDNVALLSVTTKHIDPLLDCIASGLEVAPDSEVRLFVSPSDNRFMMLASSDYISKDNYLATRIDLDVNNRNDSLAMRLATADLYIGSIHASRFGLLGGVKDNTVQLSGTFSDSLRNTRGEVAARATVSRRDSVRHIAVEMLPSQIAHGNKVWDITTRGVDIEPSYVDIRDFMVRSNNNQQLSVNGVLSKSLKDSVSMSLRNFDLAPFVQVAQRLGYEIEGRTNGFAKVKSALGDTQISANIAVDSIRVNSHRVADLTLLSDWDFGRSRASLTVANTERRDTVVRGFFSPSKMRYYARMRMSHLNMALLDPLLKGVISDTEGSGEVDLTLQGERRNAEVSGEILLRDLATTVDYTNCRYEVPKAVMNVSQNRFVVERAPMFDAYDNEGRLSIDLNMNHLSNIEYDVNVDVRDMRVLGTTRQENDMFYGDVYATGTANIRGDKSGVVMDIAAFTGDNSRFFMPLSGKSNISNADFVSFKAADLPDTTDYLVRKKLSFERRNRRRTATSGVMDINMTLDVRPNAEVQLVIDPTVGDIIKGRGEGLLNLRINPRYNIFEMYGDYTISEGSYLFTLQNIINKKFIIDAGSTIQWTGDPLDALLNIDAVYKLKASLSPLLEGSVSQSNISSRAVPVECVIHLTDRLTQPTVTFDVVVPDADSDAQAAISNALSTPESKSQQFLYLLVSNSFISESASESSAALISGSTAAATGFELLSNQLSNWLSTDDFNIAIRYRPKTEQMSDEVDFGFSKGLIDNRLLVEVEGNYIVDKSQVVNATSNFVGEAYVTWLIDRAGTLRLKGFTHTIDRFDENQGLQETGIGIYYKEEFDNFADFKRRVAARFARKQRNGAEERDRKRQRRAEAENAVDADPTERGDDAEQDEFYIFDELW